MNFKGFTLIEILISGAIVIIVGLIAMGFISGDSNPNVTWGVNGMTEERCIGGYKVVVGSSGSVQQILDNHGKGIPCN